MEPLLALWERYASMLNGGILLGLVGLILSNRFNNRKLTVEENSGLRAEFIAEMAALRQEVHSLRDENDKLRREVRGLHETIDGLRRQNVQDQISALRSFPPGEVPRGTREMLERIDAADDRSAAA